LSAASRSETLRNGTIQRSACFLNARNRLYISAPFGLCFRPALESAEATTKAARHAAAHPARPAAHARVHLEDVHRVHPAASAAARAVDLGDLGAFVVLLLLLLVRQDLESLRASMGESE